MKPLRYSTQRRQILTYLFISATVAIAVAATSAFRIGFGWNGTHMLSVCHGGVFYVQTPYPELHTGMFLRSDSVYLDWTFEAGDVPGLSKYVFLPLWPLALLPLLAAGALALRAYRQKQWQCSACQYDLRGITDTKCPECGLAIPK